jgi:hypothetical protein
LCITAKLACRCLLWVKLGLSAMSAQCPVCPPKADVEPRSCDVAQVPKAAVSSALAERIDDLEKEIVALKSMIFKLETQLKATTAEVVPLPNPLKVVKP